MFPQKNPKPFGCLLNNQSCLRSFLLQVPRDREGNFGPYWTRAIGTENNNLNWAVISDSPLSPRWEEAICETTVVSTLLHSPSVSCGEVITIWFGPLTKTNSMLTTYFNTRGKTGFLLHLTGDLKRFWGECWPCDYLMLSLTPNSELATTPRDMLSHPEQRMSPLSVFPLSPQDPTETQLWKLSGLSGQLEAKRVCCMAMHSGGVWDIWS